MPKIRPAIKTLSPISWYSQSRFSLSPSIIDSDDHVSFKHLLERGVEEYFQATRIALFFSMKSLTCWTRSSSTKFQIPMSTARSVGYLAL